MINIKTQILKKNQLTKKLIEEICYLKLQHWKNSISSQTEWFKTNIKPNDLHFLLIKKKKLIGYVLLRRRTFKLKKLKKKYYYFDTLIIDRKHRGKNLSSQLMLATKNKIIQRKEHSFLICRKKLINFYKKFGWYLFKKKEFIIDDHTYDKKYGMFLNLKSPKKKIKYYLNE